MPSWTKAASVSGNCKHGNCITKSDVRNAKSHVRFTPQKRTCAVQNEMSAKGQERTSPPPKTMACPVALPRSMRVLLPPFPRLREASRPYAPLRRFGLVLLGFICLAKASGQSPTLPHQPCTHIGAVR
jgi:hypothetical protein